MSNPAALVFEAPVQPRLRDLNIGRHLDSVECIRLLDEARMNFFDFAALPVNAEGQRGIGARLDRARAAYLMAAQRVDYRDEITFTGYEPYLARIWVSRIGSSSFDVSGELRVTPDGSPAVVNTCTMVLRDRASGAPFRIEDGFREDLSAYLAGPSPLRDA